MTHYEGVLDWSGRSLSSAKIAAMVGALLLFMVAAVEAQNRTLGEIRGTVVDQSNARIADVEVSLTNALTGVTTNLKANSDGVYDAVSLVPGTYSITFKKEGFKTFKQDDVLVRAELVTLNASLGVGSVENTIEVTATPSEIQTESAVQITDLSTTVVQELPNVGRNENAYQLLVPGIQPTGLALSNNNAGGNMAATNNNIYPAVAGKEGGEILWTLDGAMRTLPLSQYPWIGNPPVDDIQSLSFLTNNFGAEYGNGMSVFAAITKSGGNKWHGTAYEYIQNDFFNAIGQPNTTKVPPFRWNMYGGTVGGPIVKNKAFFFFSFQNNPSKTFTPLAFTFPTAAMRAGDFSQYPALDINGNPTGLAQTVYDPNSLVGTTRTPLPGNQVTTINPVSAKVQQFFPLPNYLTPFMQSSGQNPTACSQVGVVLPPACFRNNYYFTFKTPTSLKFYNARVDYDLAANNRLDASLQIAKQGQPLPSQGGGPYIFGLLEQNYIQYTGQISDYWTINSHLVNEFRYAVNRFDGYFQGSDNNKGYMAKLGIANDLSTMFPGVATTGAFGFGFNTGWPEFDAHRVEESFVPSDILTWVAGKHILKIGGEFDRYQGNGAWNNPENFIFSGITTSDPSAIAAANQAGTDPSAFQGVPYADFLFGNVGEWFGAVVPTTGAREWNTQLFVQDDYKIAKNLTFNLGLRYEIASGWSEAKGKISNFDPNVVDPNAPNAATGAPLPPGTLGGIVYGNAAVAATQYDLFAPRVGFAWSPKNNWVVRGGYGIYYTMDAGNTYGQANNYGVGWGSSGFAITPDNINAAFNWASGFPGYFPAARTPDAQNFGAPTYVPHNQPLGYAEQWQGGIQHQTVAGILIDLAYVGTRGVHLPFFRDFDQVPERLLPQAVAASSSGSNVQQFRPYPQYTFIGGTLQDGFSMYNALQVSLRRQFRTGLSLVANYSQSKMHDTGTTTANGGAFSVDLYQNAHNVRANYATSAQDTPYVINGGLVYPLPVGKGKSFLNRGGVLDYVAGGWQVSSTWSLTSGIAFSPTMINGSSGPVSSGAQSGAWYPNQVGNPYKGGPVAGNPGCAAPATVHNMTNWFNPCAYAQPTPGTFGQDLRGSLRGPSQRNLDLSLAKIFKISPLGEAGQFELRWEVMDALNYHGLGIPSGTIGSGTAAQIFGFNTARSMQLGARLSF